MSERDYYLILVLCCTAAVCNSKTLLQPSLYYQQQYNDNSYDLQDLNDRYKEKRTSLSVANPIDVLRSRMKINSERMQQLERQKQQVEANRKILNVYGKRHCDSNVHSCDIGVKLDDLQPWTQFDGVSQTSNQETYYDSY